MELFPSINEEVILKEDIERVIALSLAGGIAFAIANFVTFLLEAWSLKDSLKVDQTWSKKLNKLLKTDKWKVHVVKEKQPNAFAINGPHVFITTGLIKMATENEVIAILLHEVYHTENHHSYKQLTYNFPLFSLCIFISLAVVGTTGLPLLGLFSFMISNWVIKIPYKITIGRMHENKADHYAIKMGYGKELASILKKMEKVYLRSMQDCTGMCKVINSIDESIDEHPALKKRIETVLRKSDELMKVLETKNPKIIAKFIIGSHREDGQTAK